jgi:Transposase DDE domain
MASPGGSRYTNADGATRAGRHLLAAIDHHTRTVPGQVDVDGKINEITASAPLLDTLSSTDLTCVVFTIDALHAHRYRRGAHWALWTKGNQPRLRAQLAALPWQDVEPAHRSVETRHGRREIRAATPQLLKII